MVAEEELLDDALPPSFRKLVWNSLLRLYPEEDDWDSKTVAQVVDLFTSVNLAPLFRDNERVVANVEDVLESLWECAKNDTADSNYFLFKSTAIEEKELLALQFSQRDCWKSRWLIVLRHCEQSLEMVVLIYSKLHPDNDWSRVPVGATVLVVRGEVSGAMECAGTLAQAFIEDLRKSCSGSPDRADVELEPVKMVNHHRLVCLTAMMSLDRSSFLVPESCNSVVDRFCNGDEYMELFRQIETVFQCRERRSQMILCDNTDCKRSWQPLPPMIPLYGVEEPFRCCHLSEKCTDSMFSSLKSNNPERVANDRATITALRTQLETTTTQVGIYLQELNSKNDELENAQIKHEEQIATLRADIEAKQEELRASVAMHQQGMDKLQAELSSCRQELEAEGKRTVILQAEQTQFEQALTEQEEQIGTRFLRMTRKIHALVTAKCVLEQNLRSTQRDKVTLKTEVLSCRQELANKDNKLANLRRRAIAKIRSLEQELETQAREHEREIELLNFRNRENEDALEARCKVREEQLEKQKNEVLRILTILWPIVDACNCEEAKEEKQRIAHLPGNPYNIPENMIRNPSESHCTDDDFFNSIWNNGDVSELPASAAENSNHDVRDEQMTEEDNMATAPSGGAPTDNDHGGEADNHDERNDAYNGNPSEAENSNHDVREEQTTEEDNMATAPSGGAPTDNDNDHGGEGGNHEGSGEEDGSNNGNEEKEDEDNDEDEDTDADREDEDDDGSDAEDSFSEDEHLPIPEGLDKLQDYAFAESKLQKHDDGSKFCPVCELPITKNIKNHNLFEYHPGTDGATHKKFVQSHNKTHQPTRAMDPRYHELWQVPAYLMHPKLQRGTPTVFTIDSAALHLLAKAVRKKPFQWKDLQSPLTLVEHLQKLFEEATNVNPGQAQGFGRTFKNFFASDDDMKMITSYHAAARGEDMADVPTEAPSQNAPEKEREQFAKLALPAVLARLYHLYRCISRQAKEGEFPDGIEGKTRAFAVNRINYLLTGINDECLEDGRLQWDEQIGIAKLLMDNPFTSVSDMGKRKGGRSNGKDRKRRRRR